MGRPSRCPRRDRCPFPSPVDRCHRAGRDLAFRVVERQALRNTLTDQMLSVCHVRKKGYFFCRNMAAGHYHTMKKLVFVLFSALVAANSCAPWEPSMKEVAKVKYDSELTGRKLQIVVRPSAVYQESGGFWYVRLPFTYVARNGSRRPIEMALDNDPVFDVSDLKTDKLYTFNVIETTETQLHDTSIQRYITTISDGDTTIYDASICRKHGHVMNIQIAMISAAVDYPEYESAAKSGFPNNGVIHGHDGSASCCKRLLWVCHECISKSKKWKALNPSKWDI